MGCSYQNRSICGGHNIVKNFHGRRNRVLKKKKKLILKNFTSACQKLPRKDFRYAYAYIGQISSYVPVSRINYQKKQNQIYLTIRKTVLLYCVKMIFRNIIRSVFFLFFLLLNKDLFQSFQNPTALFSA